MNRKLKIVALALPAILGIAICGCKKQAATRIYEQQPTQAIITGQIFIVTKSRQNIVLGDEKVALLDADETQQFYNRNAAQWKSNLFAFQTNIIADLNSYAALNRSKIDELINAKNYWESKMDSSELYSDGYAKAKEWMIKIDGELSILYIQGHSSPQFQKLLDDIRDQSNLLDQIFFPAPDYFYPRMAVTTSDSDGRFTFPVDQVHLFSPMYLLAKSTRETPDGSEDYWWLVDVNLDGNKTKSLILSNDNNDHLFGAVYTLFADTNMVNWLISYRQNADYDIEGQISAKETATLSDHN